MHGELTSLSLLERVGEFDNDAWQRFHDLYSPLLQHWLVQRGVQQADADDLRQEVFQVAIRELPAFQHSGRTGAFRCWLRATVSNRLRGHWRRQKQQAAAGGEQYVALAEQLADPESALSRAWDEEYRRVVCDRLLAMVEAEFQPNTMAAFRLVALKSMRPADAAAQLGMTPNAVRIAQSRVLKRLREVGRGMID